MQEQILSEPSAAEVPMFNTTSRAGNTVGKKRERISKIATPGHRNTRNGNLYHTRCI